MSYHHKTADGLEIALPPGKVVCVGRNYAQHARELGNAIPDEPLLFIKPESSLCSLEGSVALPSGYGSVHYETELAVLLKAPLKNTGAADVQQAIWGYGLALDLTLRDLQGELKKQGQPWEKAKAFDGACPLSGFVKEQSHDFLQLSANAYLNDKQVQVLQPSEMLWSMPELLAYMSRFFTLQPGDVILTGTPAGVGPLVAGDLMRIELLHGGKPVYETAISID